MLTVPFSALTLKDLPRVGGKNASLGEMISKFSETGVPVPPGFAVTAEGYRIFIAHNHLESQITQLLSGLDPLNLTNLERIGKEIRDLVDRAILPPALEQAIRSAYRQFVATFNEQVTVAVRSSATAEDLPDASFAGQHDSFLNVSTEDELLVSCKKCYVSLFNDRAIKYRIDHGFDHLKVALSVGVQLMVRSDIGSAGVAFTIDPESGFRNVVYITGAWGLGENVVQGAVSPDEFLIFKPTLSSGSYPILQKKTGKKELTMVYGAGGRGTVNTSTAPEKQSLQVLNDNEIIQLTKWCVAIEQHYKKPMDIEWAKDGITNNIWIVQARPETVRSRITDSTIHLFQMKKHGAVLCSGKAVGTKIISGRATIVHSLDDNEKVIEGAILVADSTNPDWNVMLKKAVGIVTNKGGRTSHASIVARELGIPALVGTGNATEAIADGAEITLDCSAAGTGFVYSGISEWETKTIHSENVPATKTEPLLILANPDRAFELSAYPSKGVGLLRMEFIITNSIGIHPMALVHFDQLPDGDEKNAINKITKNSASKTSFFVDTLAGSIATVAAAFYPREVIVRMSDFKSNEYASLAGGSQFEMAEENPMIGFRGASRYYHNAYKEGFRLECEAILKVRDTMGLTNVKVMIPFCRTPEEGEKVIDLMSSYGLSKEKNGLQVYCMVEIPSNVLRLEDFAKIFDGFSIGSNDLTQLTLGIDRDAATISNLFNERDPAVLELITSAIRKAGVLNKPIGLCGQAPSDFPEFASMLVNAGINSISFTPDALFRGIQNIHQSETTEITINQTAT